MNRLPALFVAGFVLELASILLVGRLAGFWVTLALMLLAPMAGMSLIRQSGISLAQAMQAAGPAPSAPPPEARRGLFQFLAGFLLLIPGFASDVLAGALLIPAIQNLIARFVLSTFNMTVRGYSGPASPGPGPVIEGEAVEILPPESRLAAPRDDRSER